MRPVISQNEGLKIAIQACAIQAVFVPDFEAKVRANANCVETHPYLFDANAEGHEYLKFCVDICRDCYLRTTTNDYTIEQILERHKLQLLDPIDYSQVADFKQRFDFIFLPAKNCVQQAFNVVCPILSLIEHCVVPIQSMGLCSFFLTPFNKSSGMFFRLFCENIQGFVERCTVALLSLLLMKANLAWRPFFATHFPWICRLAIVMTFQQHEQLFVLGIVALQRMECLIDQITYIEYLTLLLHPRLPNIPDAFNPQNHNLPLKKSRSRFDLLAPTIPNGLTATSLMISPPHLQQSLIIEAPKPVAIPPPPDVIHPDQVSGGLLATLLKQASKRSRNIQAPFVPYRPLDPQLLTHTPSSTEPTSYLLERLQDLQEDIEYEFKSLTTDSQKKAKKFEIVNENLEQLNLTAPLGAPVIAQKKRVHDEGRREFREPGGASSRGEANWEKPLAWAQAEMGVAEDGSMLWKQLSESNGARPGLGAVNSNNAADDIFNEYRQHRAQRYHQSIAQAHSGRAYDTYYTDSSRLCFICQKPGHLARECKFGLS